MSKIYTDEENIAWAKSLPAKLCSACLIIQSGDQVLMVKAEYKDHWTFPGGIVDEHESPRSAAIRETLEEVGLNFNISDCEDFSIVYTAASNGYPDRFTFAFRVTVNELVDLASLSIPNDEIDQALWVNINEVSKMAKNRGSYQVFEQNLLNPGAKLNYVETEHYDGD